MADRRLKGKLKEKQKNSHVRAAKCRYRFLEHTSDLIVQGEGPSFEKALEAVANGMITRMGSEHIRLSGKETIATEARMENQQDLVVVALTAIISECEAEAFTPAKIEIEKIERGVRIKITGERKIPENIIKAVTYHELKIAKLGNKWKITVLFDI
jgi:SHS2 domain-containing protein